MVLSMEKWKGKVAVVTGASSGIGAAIVKQLVKAGLKVAGLARRVKLMEQLSKELSSEEGIFYAVKCDMTSEEDILNSFRWVEENVGHVSILINNAGVFEVTNLIEGDTKLWKNMLDVNVLGLSIATREAVKSMRENNIDGHIVHINSITGQRLRYFKYISIYGATKFAVTALTETLRKELIANKLKIKITSISPGLVDTDILDTLKTSIPEYNGRASINAEDIADSVLYVLSTPSHVQVHEMIVAAYGQ